MSLILVVVHGVRGSEAHIRGCVFLGGNLVWEVVMVSFWFSSNSGDLKVWKRRGEGYSAQEGDVFVSREEAEGISLVMGWFGGSRPYFFLVVEGERAEGFVRLLEAYWEEQDKSHPEGERGVGDVVQVWAWFTKPWENDFWARLVRRGEELEAPFEVEG